MNVTLCIKQLLPSDRSGHRIKRDHLIKSVILCMLFWLQLTLSTLVIAEDITVTEGDAMTSVIASQSNQKIDQNMQQRLAFNLHQNPR